MRFTILTLTAVLCLALVSSHPLPEDGLRSEALDRLVMTEADSEAALRSKRTIGILRQLFPDISQRIESKVNSIIGEIIRVLGPVILRNLLGGGMGNTSGVERSDEGTSVVGKSPFDDDEEDESTSAGSNNASKVSISLPTFPPDEEETFNSSSSTTSSSIMTAESRANIDVNPESENRVNEIGSESQNNEVRVQFADEVPSDSSPQELTPLDETETEEDENRNKRFLFGFGGGSGGGAGSGNFLFDIIRQAADGAARAAGTVYRVVAGTQSLGLGLSASRDVGPAAPAAANPGGTGTPMSGASSTAAPGAGILPPLVAGSGSNQLSGSSSSDTHDVGKSDEHEAVPGPVTRFFVIANRGLSNLVQDLILVTSGSHKRAFRQLQGATDYLHHLRSHMSTGMRKHEHHRRATFASRSTGTTLATEPISRCCPLVPEILNSISSSMAVELFAKHKTLRRQTHSPKAIDSIPFDFIYSLV
ncbi:hypothetical protein ALC56_10215 [Trachymyrmex septentrionalis]|uniref:Uncharacterized protein n=1 Tax=Trachymyrmex septentrionalis TaxID=34720 RepID=A0A195F471_9HYME|nr:hypothetical protein ALC56_10215 [Trachymyrmex septentrionalis]